MPFPPLPPWKPVDSYRRAPHQSHIDATNRLSTLASNLGDVISLPGGTSIVNGGADVRHERRLGIIAEPSSPGLAVDPPRYWVNFAYPDDVSPSTDGSEQVTLLPDPPGDYPDGEQIEPYPIVATNLGGTSWSPEVGDEVELIAIYDRGSPSLKRWVFFATDSLLRPVIVRVRLDGGANPADLGLTCNFTYLIYHYGGTHTDPLATILSPMKRREVGRPYESAVDDTLGAAVYLPPPVGEWFLIEAFDERAGTASIEAVIDNGTTSSPFGLTMTKQHTLVLAKETAGLPEVFAPGTECPVESEPSFDDGEE